MKVNKRKLEILMAEKCMNLNDLASKAGVSRACLYAMRKGATPQLCNLGKIAKALNVHVADILEEEEL